MTTNTNPTTTSGGGGPDQVTMAFIMATSFIVILVIVMIFVCWKKGAGNCRINWTHAREEMAAIIRRQQEQRRAAETKRNPETRKLVIQKTIVRRKCSAEHSDTDDTAAIASASRRSEDCCSYSSSKSSIDIAMVTQDQGDDSSTVGENVCSVCLDPFLPDQEIAWSKDLKCRHCFHAECLIPWLMKHDDCPLCRTLIMCHEDFAAVDSNRKEMTSDKGSHDIESCAGESDHGQPFEIRNGQICFKDDVDENVMGNEFFRFPIVLPTDDVNGEGEDCLEEVNNTT